jgi:hypothetical protein
MKILDPEIQIQTNVSGHTEFKMQQNRKAFQILSDLYSDKPLAIVRELGCNAWDSHKVAGNPNPFKIHLPNEIEPWLTIQDFGTGISHEDIYNIYTTYFASTKTESNNQIGCLGLGSKSPFCYTDNFMITSITNNKKRMYSAFFNEKGLPSISLMGIIDTEESSGLSIQIPIQKESFDLFKKAVKKAFQFFDVKPIITGGIIDWDDLGKVNVEGVDWKSYEILDDSYAVMGGVAYPVSTYHLSEQNSNFLHRVKIVAHFEMGQLDFTPSREDLSYCELTINSLNKKFDDIRESFVQNFRESLLKKENIMDALLAVIHFNENFSYIVKQRSNFIWNDIDITEPFKWIKDNINDPNKGIIYNHSYSRYSRKKFSYSIGSPSFKKLDHTIFVKSDKPVPPSVIRYNLKTNPDNIYSVFNTDAYQNWINLGFDDSDFVDANSLPKPPKAPRISVPSERKKFAIYKMGYHGDNKWESSELDPNNIPTFYIIKKIGCGYNFYFSNKYINFSDKKDLSNFLGNNGYTDDDICMVSEKKAEYLEKLGAKPFKDFFESYEIKYNLDEVQNFTIMEKFSRFIQDYKDIVVDHKEKCPIYKMITEIESVNGSLHVNEYHMYIAKNHFRHDTKSNLLEYVKQRVTFDDPMVEKFVDFLLENGTYESSYYSPTTKIFCLLNEYYKKTLTDD